MLSRGASDASTRLRRSKSSASVYRRQDEPLIKETIDPETARRHAVTAAHIAMNRASERAATELRRSAELSRKQSTASRAGSEVTPGSQNIHFCETIEARRLRPTLQLRAPTAAPAVYMPMSNSFSQLSKPGHRPPLDEFGVTDGYGSVPSSYRRLRKTKSMLVPRRSGPTIPDLFPQSPGTPRTLRNVKSSLSDHDHRLRLGLKRSISFLKSGSGNHAKTFKRSHGACEHSDEAVQQAREQFMQNFEQQRLQGKSSFLSTPMIRQQKAFRKTVRSNKTTEYGNGVMSDHQQRGQESKFRSFSASLKDRVRRALGRSTNKDGNLPAQQLDASRAHFRDYLDGTGFSASHEAYATDNLDSGSRRSFYMPSSQEEELTEDLEAITKSFGTAHSNDSLGSNGRSRVTSWTNSTMTNTLPGRGTPTEKKRLSIIQEHGGPHRPSSSIGRHMDEVSANHLPLSARQGNGLLTAPIDSQRVYSALIKRISQEQDEQDQAEAPKPEPLHDATQTYTSSAKDFQAASTIRQVSSEESIRTLAPNLQHRRSSFHAPLRQKVECKTPQQIALENEALEKRGSLGPLHETQSSIVPFPNENRPPTQSPFKRAFASRREQQSSSEEGNGSVLITRPVQGGHGFELSSESLYSRSTSDQLPVTGMNRSNPELVEEPTGTTSNLPALVKGCPSSSRPSVEFRKAKSNASPERKSWNKNEVSSLERRNFESGVAHYREGAQIDGDDTAIGGRRGSFTGPGRRCAARAVEGNETPADQRRASIMNERFPLLELKEVPRKNTPQPRRSSSMMRFASSTAAASKQAGLPAAGVNDENARITSIGTAAPYPLQPRYSEMSLKDGDGPACTPERLAHHHPQLSGRLRKPQSLMMISTPYGRITETSGDEEDPVHGPSTTARLGRPLDSDGYGGARGLMVMSRESLAHSPNLGTEKEEGIEYEKDTAAPRTPNIAGKKRQHKAGMSIPISSKRMVSNFLRSRRRNGANLVSGESGNRVGDETSPAFV